MNNVKQAQEIDYKRLAKIILSRWYWIAGSVVLFYFMGYLYLRYKQPMYISEASLKFDEKKSELTELINVRNLYDRTNKVESEKSVIRSRAVALSAMAAMDYKISFYKEGKFVTTDLYPEKPLLIEILEVDYPSAGNSRKRPLQFSFKYKNVKNYHLSYVDDQEPIDKDYSFGETVKIRGLKFRIVSIMPIKNPGDSFLFVFNGPSQFLARLKKSLKLDDTQNLNILNLKITDQNPYFAADALNSLLKAYLEFDKKQRSVSATQTTSFIDTLLGDMSSDLRNSGLAIEKFKKESQLLDISTVSQGKIEELSSLETEQHKVKIQLMLVKLLDKDFTSNSLVIKNAFTNSNGNGVFQHSNTSQDNRFSSSLLDDKIRKDEVFENNLTNANSINANLQGVTDPQLNSLLTILNELLVKKKLELETYNVSSVHIKNLDQQINTYRISVRNNLKDQIKKNNSLLAYLSNRIDVTRSTLKDLPGTERNLINLQSSFNVNQKVHAYLSEKKLESQISKASVIPGAIILDSAVLSTIPISPIPREIYTLFVLIGLIAGLSGIFLIRTFNPYLYNRETIEGLTRMPILGMIKKLPFDKLNDFKIPAIDNPRSAFSESVRSVRTNLSFIASEKQCKVICITSEISGEGKSFTAMNLSAALSLIEKKVVLISADLRKHKMHHDLGIHSTNGLSNYLSGQADLQEILISTEIPNLSIIPSGPLPPNPSELLQTLKMRKLIEILEEHFDFIILDTAPIGLVSDAMPLLKMADITLFVIRYGVSSYYSALLPDKISKEFNLKSSAIILNAFESNSFHSQYYASTKHHHYQTASYKAYQYYTEEGQTTSGFHKTLTSWKKKQKSHG
jgi:tyrosine-protein kinase Etk/Wzc